MKTTLSLITMPSVKAAEFKRDTIEGEVKLLMADLGKQPTAGDIAPIASKATLLSQKHKALAPMYKERQTVMEATARDGKIVATVASLAALISLVAHFSGANQGIFARMGRLPVAAVAGGLGIAGTVQAGIASHGAKKAEKRADTALKQEEYCTTVLPRMLNRLVQA